MSDYEERQSKQRFEEHRYTMKLIKRIVAIVAVVVILSTVFSTISSSIVTIESGYRGVLLNFGQPIGVLSEGFHTITPFVQSVVRMNVQIQKAETDEATATKDLQEIQTSIAVNYQLDDGFIIEIYRDLRNEYESRVIKPAIEEGIKATTSKFTTEELITEREQAKMAFQVNLEERLSMFHINVKTVSITNFQFSESFSAAIDAKNTQVQKALEAKNKLDEVYYQQQQKILQAQAEANATVTKATADAQAQLIAAQAQAEAIRLIQEQLSKNPAYLQYILYQQWDGKLPVVWVGSQNGTSPFMILLPWNYTQP